MIKSAALIANLQSEYNERLNEKGLVHETQ